MKKVVITFNRSPHGTAYYSEGLRLASGMPINDHDTKLVFLGDGVFSSLKDNDSSGAEKFIKTVEEYNFPFYVEKESLAKRRISDNDIDEKFTIISREKVLEILKDCHIHIGV